jgi:hypothetical protein
MQLLMLVLLQRTQEGHRGAVTSIAYSPDETKMVSSCKMRLVGRCDGAHMSRRDARGVGDDLERVGRQSDHY